MARLAVSALGDGAAGWLRADRANIWLEPGFDLEVDFEAHQEALRTTLVTPSGPERDRRLALALTERGRLLEDEPYADWALAPREALESLRQEACLALARDRAKGIGRCGQSDVIDAWEACSHGDPASEEAAGPYHAYSAQGRHALAATTYGRCRQALEDLGLRASPALEELAQASRSQPGLSPARQLVAPGEEHRVVSVLFAGLSGAVGTGERLGSEDLPRPHQWCLGGRSSSSRGIWRHRDDRFWCWAGGGLRCSRVTRGRPRKGPCGPPSAQLGTRAPMAMGFRCA